MKRIGSIERVPPVPARSGNRSPDRHRPVKPGPERDDGSTEDSRRRKESGVDRYAGGCCSPQSSPRIAATPASACSDHGYLKGGPEHVE